jgi:hypothetical protein
MPNAGAHSELIELADFTADGWRPAESAITRARASGEQLERGKILLLRDPLLVVSAADQALLTNVPPAVVKHKNIAFDSVKGKLRGLRRGVEAQHLQEAMTRYSTRVVELCATLLAPYARSWRVELSSFRPLEEEDRRLPRRQRNDLLHIDSFPARPTNGARILRCFTNIHPSRPRVWTTSEPFKLLSEETLWANLEHIARRARSPWSGFGRGARQFLRGISPNRSAYDEFMLSLHDRMKTDARYDAEASKFHHEFPAGATWLVFTDSVPHAVMAGQFALEQTFIVPRDALLLPAEAPVAIIERLAGHRMTA